MSTKSLEDLQIALEAIGLQSVDFTTPSTDVLYDPLSICFQDLAATVVQLTDCSQEVAYGSIVWSNDMTHLVVKVPRLRVRDVKPQDLTAELQPKWPQSMLFGHPFPDGISLLFYFKTTGLARILLPYIFDRGSSYGRQYTCNASKATSADGEAGVALVEFSSPNIAKAFDSLHLRSTIVGKFVASVYENMGWNVQRMNFLGDWGKHIGLLAAGWSRFGSEEALVQGPLKCLLGVYVRTTQLQEEQRQELLLTNGTNDHDDHPPIFTAIEKERDYHCKQLEDGDPKSIALWQKFRDVCVSQYAEVYTHLGIKFDDYSAESQVSKETLHEVENLLKEKDAYREMAEGCFIEFSKLEQKGLGVVKARSQDGTTTYLLRDIAAVLERSRKYAFDKMIYVVSARQSTHFAQVFKALEIMGLPELAQKLEHVNFADVHGLNAKDGTHNLLLGDILDQCENATKLALATDQDESGQFFGLDPATNAAALGVMNLTVEMLSCKRSNVFECDINQIAAEGDHTGLGLQKWYSTLCTSLKGVNINRVDLETADYSIFEGEDDLYAEVLRLLLQYPSTVRNWAYEKLDPSHVLTYLFGLVDALATIWDEPGESEASTLNLAKLGLYECVRQTLENGMRLLGLTPIAV